MRRFLLSCAILAVLAVPAAAAARASASAKPGYVVVRNAFSDGGVNGSPVVTVVVRGFVLGRVSQEAEVEIYHLPSASGQGGPLVKGADVSHVHVRWHDLPGTRYSGSNFRFRGTGGFYRVVVRGSGVYVFAGGRGRVWLQGSSANPRRDGVYSVNNGAFRSMPTKQLKREIGRG
jgi:hypothetical protein